MTDSMTDQLAADQMLNQMMNFQNQITAQIITVTISIIFLLLIIVFEVFLSKKYSTLLTSKLPLNKVMKFTFIVYTAILLCSFVILYVLPKKDFIPVATNKQKAVAMVYSNFSHPSSFFNSVKGGTSDTYKNGSWSFNFNGKLLEITSPKYVYIMVDQKAVNDNKVEVTYYRNNLIVYGNNYSHKVKSLNVTSKGNKINISYPEKRSFECFQFINDFTLNQFSDKNIARQDFGSNSELSPDIIYLRIPHNVVIDKPNQIAHFVENK